MPSGAAGGKRPSPSPRSRLPAWERASGNATCSCCPRTTRSRKDEGRAAGRREPGHPVPAGRAAARPDPGGRLAAVAGRPRHLHPGASAVGCRVPGAQPAGPGPARLAPHRDPREPPAAGNPDEQESVGPDAGSAAEQRGQVHSGHPRRADDQRRRVPRQDRDRLPGRGRVRGPVAGYPPPARPRPSSRDPGPVRARRLLPAPGQGDALRDHATTALLIDDITRLKLHRGDDQDTLDLIRELMDLGATLVLIGVDIPGSGLLGRARPDPASGQWAFPAAHGDAAATQTSRRFDLADLDPFDYSAPDGMTAFIAHLAGIEEQLRLLRSSDGMLTTGEMPEYLFRRTEGVVGLLRRLIEDGCAKAIATGEEQLTRELLAATPIRLRNLHDLDPDSGEIPDIPAAPDPPEPKKKRRPRNTVFDEHGTRPAASE